MTEIRFLAAKYTGAVGADQAQLANQLAQEVPGLLALIDDLRTKLAKPCGSCHPCDNYADETWRAAGRKPPHVTEWDETQAQLTRLRAELEQVREQRDAHASMADELRAELAAARDEVRATALELLRSRPVDLHPAYPVARCGQLSAHGPHVVDHGPDQPRNCPGTADDGPVQVVPHGPVRPPYGSPEREAYDREHAPS